MTKNLVWFRNDLRIEDNPALWYAGDNNHSVLGVFILTPQQWKRHHMAGSRVAFLLSSLKVLRDDLSRLGIPLQVICGDAFSGVPDLLLNFCREHRVDAVFWNNEYPLDEVQRDNTVEHSLAENGIPVRRFHDRVLLPPESLQTRQGKPYKVFTPFKKNLLSQLDQGLPDLMPAPEKRKGMKLTLNEIPTSLPGFASDIDISAWPAGEREAGKRLERFISSGLAGYQDNRDIPAVDGTSSLSPYLAIGNLSPQRCLIAALSGQQGRGADSWISEIVWRDFYQYIAWHFPRVCKYQPFNPDTETVPWRCDRVQFDAWKEGRTGVPLVDAGMRQLKETGWMHNRVRMVVAMFLTKNLLIDWRWGERFFMNHLIDGDFCANNGGWQWSASTGTDAAPYFRIFNPFSQAEKFDPQAIYIKTYVPELRELDAKSIHKPSRLSKVRPDSYPDMMVDLGSSRRRAIEVFRKSTRS